MKDAATKFILNWLLARIAWLFGFDSFRDSSTDFCAMVPFDQFSVQAEYSCNPHYEEEVRADFVKKLKIQLMDNLIEEGVVQVIDVPNHRDNKKILQLTLMAAVGEPS